MSFGQEAIDACFAELGKPATLTRRDASTAVCVVILNSQDVELRIGRAVTKGRALEVRASEVGDMAGQSGATFTLSDTGEILKVIDDPRCEDPDRLVWTMTAR